MRSFLLSITLCALTLGFVACPNSCGAKKSAASTGAKQVKTFPSLDFGTLDSAKQEAFANIVNAEICPCGCAKTFAECLAPGAHCEPAKVFAQWIIRMLAEDVPADKLAVVVSHEITDGFAAKPAHIETQGFGTKGSDNAKNVIVEFADFQCTHCKAATEELNKYVHKKEADIMLVYKHFPLHDVHDMAKKSALAVEAAGHQGKFWDMHMAIFMNQTRLSDKLINELAKEVGLKLSQFEKDLKSPAIAARVEQSIEEGKRLGIHSTPAIFINGRPFHLAVNEYNLSTRLAMENARSQMKCDP
jgi:protein-disulfide isomerase